MKKVMIKSGIIAGTLMGTFTLASIQKIVAQSKNENPVEFKYMGKTNNQPVFQLMLHNAEPNEFIITLTDENGAVIYDDRVAGKDVARRYLLDLDEIDASVIRFQIR